MSLDHTVHLLRRYDREGGRHAHDHAQVLFGVDGTLQLEVEGRATWVDASCGLVVPAGASHGYAAVRTAQVLVLDLPAGPATDRMRRFALPVGWRQRAPAPEDLLATLLGAPTLAPRRRLDLDALAARIDADLARRWTVADLAAACCLSPQRLRARFAQALDLAPLDFVRARRLDRAEHLLHQGLSLEAVALQVGYARASALSAALRRERDTGARALRRRRALRES
jgi:AraC-like DNA-binding protein